MHFIFIVTIASGLVTFEIQTVGLMYHDHTTRFQFPLHGNTKTGAVIEYEN